MIIGWLEIQKLSDFKTFTYGRTRSFSLLGSAVSAPLAAVMMIYTPAKYQAIIFLFSAIPYVLDFLLIWSYPAYMNEGHFDDELSICASFSKQMKTLCQHSTTKDLRKVLVSGALFAAIYFCLKNYVQFILMAMIGKVIVQAGYGGTSEAIQDNWLSIILGIIYCIYNLISSVAAKKTYLITNHIEAKTGADMLFYMWGMNLVAVGICIKFQFPWPILFLYAYFYIARSVQRPLIVTCYGDLMEKKHKTAVLSIEECMQTFFMFVLAPLFGLIATHWGVDNLFICLGPVMCVLNVLCLTGKYTKLEKKKKKKEKPSNEQNYQNDVEQQQTPKEESKQLLQASPRKLQ
jgi:hypothetical protein